MAKICLHCFVSGRVQGVFYRRETVEQAIARALKGWVKNLLDGRVEVMICGEEADVRAMETWLWQGPRAAQVDTVAATIVPVENFQQFEVRN